MLRSRATDSWLSVTPEPERLLPEALATLVCHGQPSEVDVRRERVRAERLVVRGSQRAWLAYLSAAVRLIDDADADADPHVAGARELARDVIANHHNLLLGLPGGAARRTESERVYLRATPEPRPLPSRPFPTSEGRP